MNSIHHCDFCVTLRFSLMTFRILQFAIHALQYALAVSMRSVSVCARERILPRICQTCKSHITPILPTDLKQCVGDLTQRTFFADFHQGFKYVLVLDCGLL